MDHLKNGPDPVKMAEAELAAAAFRESGLEPGSYEAAKAHMNAETVKPRRPLRGDPPVTMIFKAMGLVDENGVPAPREDGK
jgi:hypothetical protein